MATIIYKTSKARCVSDMSSDVLKYKKLRFSGRQIIYLCIFSIIILAIYKFKSLSYDDILQNLAVLREQKFNLSFSNKISNSCFGIKNLSELVRILDDPTNALSGTCNNIDCMITPKLLEIIFDIDSSNETTQLRIPSKKMKRLITQVWLQNDSSLYKQFLSQKTVTLTNRWTHESTGINPLRALRPRQIQNLDSLNFTLDLIKSSQSGCNFCNKDYTTMDSFGRIEVNGSRSNMYSAHNSFQYTDPVGLFIPKDIHNWMQVG